MMTLTEFLLTVAVGIAISPFVLLVIVTVHELRTVQILAQLFRFAFSRHCRDLHNADYEVCRNVLCRFAWRTERITHYQEKFTQ